MILEAALLRETRISISIAAITYKEIFPLLKNDVLWLGSTRPKEFIQRNGKIKKFGNITWFTNLDIKKRHEDFVFIK